MTPEDLAKKAINILNDIIEKLEELELKHQNAEPQGLGIK
jgi:hypothetical protein